MGFNLGKTLGLNRLGKEVGRGLKQVGKLGLTVGGLALGGNPIGSLAMSLLKGGNLQQAAVDYGMQRLRGQHGLSGGQSQQPSMYNEWGGPNRSNAIWNTNVFDAASNQQEGMQPTGTEGSQEQNRRTGPTIHDAMMPIWGQVADYGLRQIFGKSPSGVFAPPPNPYAGQLVQGAQQRLGQYATGNAQLQQSIDGLVQNQLSALNGGQDQAERIALGQAQTGADKAFNRARSNLSLNLNQRNLGGGLKVGSLANLEGQRASAMTNAYNTAALQRTARNDANRRYMLQFLSNQLAQNNTLSQRDQQFLMNQGNWESERLALGQPGFTDLLRYHFRPRK